MRVHAQLINLCKILLTLHEGGLVDVVLVSIWTRLKIQERELVLGLDNDLFDDVNQVLHFAQLLELLVDGFLACTVQHP